MLYNYRQKSCCIKRRGCRARFSAATPSGQPVHDRSPANAGSFPCIIFLSVCYSHSTVAGGLLDTSYTTLEMPGTSFVIRLLARSRTS